MHGTFVIFPGCGRLSNIAVWIISDGQNLEHNAVGTTYEVREVKSCHAKNQAEGHSFGLVPNQSS